MKETDFTAGFVNAVVDENFFMPLSQNLFAMLTHVTCITFIIKLLIKLMLPLMLLNIWLHGTR